MTPRFIPKSYAEFRVAYLAGQPGLRTKCRTCGKPFSLINTHNVPAWQRTQTVGVCEDCEIAQQKEKAA